MTANSKELEGGYDPLEDPFYVHGPIWLAITSILLDRLLAVILWSYEGNPLVMSLGIPKWLFLTLILIAGMLFAWYTSEGVSNDIVRALTYGIAVAHVFIVLMNISVVILS